MKNGRAACAEHELACAQVAARFRERWLRIYARQKLRSDPVFPAAFALLREATAPIIDLGCGVGLLAFYLRERNFSPPIIGLDRDGRKIDRAKAARCDDRDVEFFQQDVRGPVSQTGNIVLFDLLHYLRPNEQVDLLTRAIPQVPPGGLLLIRDCPRDRSARFWLTLLAERFAQITSWNLNTTLHFPARETILAPFAANEFSHTIEPLWGRTPFNNHLFIFRRRPGATARPAVSRSGSPPSPAP
jgi:SAM-dependent methyltransferase